MENTTQNSPSGENMEHTLKFRAKIRNISFGKWVLTIFLLFSYHSMLVQVKFTSSRSSQIINYLKLKNTCTHHKYVDSLTMQMLISIQMLGVMTQE